MYILFEKKYYINPISTHKIVYLWSKDGYSQPLLLSIRIRDLVEKKKQRLLFLSLSLVRSTAKQSIARQRADQGSVLCKLINIPMLPATGEKFGSSCVKVHDDDGSSGKKLTLKALKRRRLSCVRLTPHEFLFTRA